MRIFAGAAFVVALVILAGCIEENNGAVGVVMTMKEFSEQINETFDNASSTYRVVFELLEPGDVVHLRDTIAGKQFPEPNVTLLIFETEQSGGLHFDGNLTDFAVGDDVQVTLHIQSEAFNQSYSGQTIRFEMEMFAEGWDFSEHVPKLVPRDAIRHR
jgi:hypothetical protein